MLNIALWDDSHSRLMELESHLQSALKELGLEADIVLHCEPPLLGRNGLVGKTPAVQCGGGPFWTRKPGESISKAQFCALLRSPEFRAFQFLKVV